MKRNKCIDCNKKIDNRSTRCSSCAQKGVNNPFYGKHHTKENKIIIGQFSKKREKTTKERLKLSQSKMGHFVSLETRNKISKALKGFKHNEKTKKLLSQLRRGKNNSFYGKKHNFKTKQQLSLIHGGTGVPYENTEYGAKFDNVLKEQVRFRDHYKCQECGCSQLENGRQLDCHHIDYDKLNNILRNLISLCMKCHRKTNANRDYWEKHFKEVIYVR